MALTLVVLLPSVARAEVSLGTFQTTGCTVGAPLTWRIGYRLYFADDAGHTTDRAAIPGLADHLQQFVDRVGPDSGCSLRLEVDLYDMQAATWEAARTREDDADPAPDHAGFLAAGGYDSAFYRVPAHGGEVYAGITAAYGTQQPWSIYPVDAGGRSYPSDPPADPWYGLIFHEFMHQAVGFYDPAQGWPSNDVHGGAEHGWTDFPYVNEAYFTAMLQGSVPEGGRMTGMLPADYVKDGTPAHPVRSAFPSPTLGSDGYELVYRAPSNLTGSVSLVVRRNATGRTVQSDVLSAPNAVWRWLPTAVGTYTVELDHPGSERYRRFHTAWTVAIGNLDPRLTIKPIRPSPIVTRRERCRVPRLHGLTLRQARRKLVAKHCSLGRVKRRPIHRGKGGRVLGQRPTAGHVLAGGSPVRISLGRRLRG